VEDPSQIKDIQDLLTRINRNLAYFRHARKFGRRIGKLEESVYKVGIWGGAAMVGLAILAGTTWLQVPRVAASTAEDKAREVATDIVDEKLPAIIVQEIESCRDRAVVAANEAENMKGEIAATLNRLREGIPLGMVLPFFGKTVPNGFVLANGEAKWPDEDWVPDHLRGAKVPDLHGQMLGGS
jgi:hypothetical protein